MNKDTHRKMLNGFEVDRLIKLLAIEAKKHHDGHFTILSFTTHYKVAFGTPNFGTAFGGDAQLHKMTGFEKLKDALVDTLVEGKSFSDYDSGDGGLSFMEDEIEVIKNESIRQVVRGAK